MVLCTSEHVQTQSRREQSRMEGISHAPLGKSFILRRLIDLWLWKWSVCSEVVVLRSRSRRSHSKPVLVVYDIEISVPLEHLGISAPDVRAFRDCFRCPCVGLACDDPRVLGHCCLSCLSDPLVVDHSEGVFG